MITKLVIKSGVKNLSPIGLAAVLILAVFISGCGGGSPKPIIYAATSGGLSISTDGGVSFTNKTTVNGLGRNEVLEICISGSKIYIATPEGLSIYDYNTSTSNNKTTGNGLGDNVVIKPFV